MTRSARLDDATIGSWLTDNPNWQLVEGHLIQELRTTDYASAVRLVLAQADIAERLEHHPIITLGYQEVRLELWTHDRGGLTHLDLDYATAFDDLVRSAFGDVVHG